MKTFYQFLQEIYTPHPDHDKSNADLKAIVSKLTHEQQVLFALHCAEDCYELITDNELKELAYNCIQLIKQWLTPNKPTYQKLRQAANAAADAADAAAYATYAYAAADAVATRAVRAAANAADTASYAAAAADTTYAAYAAANAAANAAYYVVYADVADVADVTNANANTVYNTKISQYRQDALTIGSSYTPEIPHANFNDIVKALKQGNFDKNGIETFLDALQEAEYDDLLKYDGQSVYLAMLPNLKAKTTNDLANLLYKNKYKFMLALKTIRI